MALMKTKVNIVLKNGFPPRCASTENQSQFEKPAGRRLTVQRLTICVAISTETITFREPSGRKPRCEGRSGA
jgi:hypothetical protein